MRLWGCNKMRRLLLISLMYCSVTSALAIDDPTRPAVLQTTEVDSTVTTEGAVLTAIMLIAERRVAVINGVSMTEGSEQLGIKVKKINADNVIIEQLLDGLVQTRTLRVNSTGEIKKNATDNF